MRPQSAGSPARILPVLPGDAFKDGKGKSPADSLIPASIMEYVNAVQHWNHQRSTEAGRAGAGYAEVIQLLERANERYKETIDILQKEKAELVDDLWSVKEALAERDYRDARPPNERASLVQRQLADAKKELHAVRQDNETLKSQLQNTPVAPPQPNPQPNRPGRSYRHSQDDSQSAALQIELAHAQAELRRSHEAREELKVELDQTQVKLMRSENAREDLSAELAHKKAEITRMNMAKHESGSRGSISRDTNLVHKMHELNSELAHAQAELGRTQNARDDLAIKLKRVQHENEELKKSKEEPANSQSNLKQQGPRQFEPTARQQGPRPPVASPAPKVHPQSAKMAPNQFAPVQRTVEESKTLKSLPDDSQQSQQVAHGQTDNQSTANSSPVQTTGTTSPVPTSPRQTGSAKETVSSPLPKRRVKSDNTESTAKDPGATARQSRTSESQGRRQSPGPHLSPSPGPHRVNRVKSSPSPGPHRSTSRTRQEHRGPASSREHSRTRGSPKAHAGTTLIDVDLPDGGTEGAAHEAPKLNQNESEMIAHFCQGLARHFGTRSGDIDWARAFDKLDTRRNKVLSKAEFLNGLTRLGGFSMATKTKLHKLIDRDGSGIISQDEWAVLKYYHKILCTEEGERLRAAKEQHLKLLNESVLDEDPEHSGNGQHVLWLDNHERITEHELALVNRFVEFLKKSFHRSADNRLVDFTAVFRDIDANGNRLISSLEFLDFLHKIGWLTADNLTASKNAQQHQEILDGRRLFRLLDKDKSGVLSLDEFNVFEYYIDCSEKLTKKIAERARIEAEYKRVWEEEEEQRRMEELEHQRTLLMDVQVPDRTFSQEQIALHDQGWIEFEKLGPTIAVDEQGPKFIAAVDGSDQSMKALHFYTEFWFRRHRPSHLSVVHIADPSRTVVPQYRAEAVEAQCETWLVSAIPKSRWKIRVECKENASEKTRHMLTQVVREENGHFLLAGCIGSKGPLSRTTGSTALHLLSNARVPILLVPDAAKIPKVGEPCRHVVFVRNDQASLKAFIDCMRLAGPEDSIDVVHVGVDSPGNTGLKVLQSKYEYIFNSIVSHPDDTDPTSLPGMLRRAGPWPTCSFVLLQPLREGQAATVWNYVTQVEAKFAYVGLGQRDLEFTHEFVNMMTCPTLVSDFSKPWHISSMHRRHEKSEAAGATATDSEKRALFSSTI